LPRHGGLFVMYRKHKPGASRDGLLDIQGINMGLRVE